MSERVPPVARLAPAAILVLLLSSGPALPASAATLLTFEGLGNQAAIGSFYDGGGGGNLGITFGSNVIGLIDADAGGTGQFGNEPSPSTVALIAAPVFGAVAFTVDVAGGFSDRLSFYYANIAANIPVTVEVRSGLGGSGSLLASASRGVSPAVACDPGGLAQLCSFAQVSLPFAGVAQSIVFSGRQGFVVFDDIALGAPEPAIASLLGIGALVLCSLHLRRRPREAGPR